MIGEETPVVVDEKVVIQKFNGDSTDPEDEFERVHLHNGKITHIETIEHGEVVRTDVRDSEILETVKEVA